LQHVAFDTYRFVGDKYKNDFDAASGDVQLSMVFLVAVKV